MTSSIHRIAFAFLLIALGACNTTRNETTTRAKFEPSDGKILVLVGQNDFSSENYIRATGVVPAGFMFYTSIQLLNGLWTPHSQEGTVSHAQHFVDRYPNSTLQLALYMVNAEKDVADGKFDSNIDRLAEWIQKTERPVFLRIGYEFDGGHNHYDPGEYIRAYRRIVDRFRARGVDNVAYVWHSCGMPISRPTSDWYPGDKYVDWFAISIFSQNKSWTMPVIKMAQEKNKPVMIAESTPQGYRTAHGTPVWKFWFEPYFKYVRDNNIKAISYINDDWDSIGMWKGQGWGDARVEASAEIKRRWMDEMKDPRYLQASNELFEELRGHENQRGK